MMLQRSLAALTVMLGVTGCAPAGPRQDPERVESMRRVLALAAPQGQVLSYLAHGDVQGLPVIYVHGTPGSAQGWADYLLQPVAGSRSLAPDRPGFGRSGPDQAVTGLALQAQAVASLLPADGREVVVHESRRGDQFDADLLHQVRSLTYVRDGGRNNFSD